MKGIEYELPVYIVRGNLKLTFTETSVIYRFLKKVVMYFRIAPVLHCSPLLFLHNNYIVSRLPSFYKYNNQ